MKKLILSFLLAAACVAFCAHALAASGADASLVSVRYLEDAFLSGLTETIQFRVSGAMQPVRDEAQERLDRLGREYLSDSSGDGPVWSYADTAQVCDLKRGDVVTISTGSTVLWTAGVAEAADDGLVDATAGSELAAGGRLTAGHRYLNGAEEGPVAVTVLSDAAQMLLVGRWVLAESGDQVTGFTDLLQETDWFYDGVYYVVERGLFNGTSATEFSPHTAMNRSMLATVLHRLAGSPEAPYNGAFTDVPAGQWYTQGVTWAAQARVVIGREDGSFGPTADVTREQIATMLYRYAGEHLGMDVSQAGDLSGYSDCAQVSVWARETMSWAVGAGIIAGTDTGLLLPGSNASRAEVAIMLQRFETWAS